MIIDSTQQSLALFTVEVNIPVELIAISILQISPPVTYLTAVAVFEVADLHVQQ